MALRVDGAGHQVVAGEIDLALGRGQKRVPTNGGDFAVDDCSAAFDGASGGDDQTIPKNYVGSFASHVFDFLIYFLASVR